MSCQLNGLPTYDEALERLLARAQFLGCEEVALEEADGRVLAQTILAPRCRPAVPVSAMDGYAIRSQDLAVMAGGLAVAGVSYAGGRAVPALRPGEAMRVITGAPLPPGADRVIVDEDVRVTDGVVALQATPGSGRHVREVGSDFRTGAVLVEAGTLMTPQALMAAAAGEAARIMVVSRPRVALILTGDEIAAPGVAGPSAVPDSVSFGVAAMVRAWGGVISGVWRCVDDRAGVVAGLAAAQAQSDVTVVIGGASKSERDHSRSAARCEGAELLFAGVAIKPGKPVWSARRADGGLMVGLPGNPGAALVTARLFLAPLVAQLSGRGAGRALAWEPAHLLEAAPAASGRETFLLATERSGGLKLAASQAASGQACLATVGAIVRRPAQGERLEALRL